MLGSRLTARIGGLNIVSARCSLPQSSKTCTSKLSHSSLSKCPNLAGKYRFASPLRHIHPISKNSTYPPAASSSDAEIIPAPETAPPPPAFDPVTEVARQNLNTAANVCRRYGWIAFWVQLVLTSVASVIVLFSMAFTSQTGPSISLYLTLFGIVMGYLSTFWSFGYTRLSRKLRAFLDYDGIGDAPKIRRTDVINMLEKGAIINALGAGASMLGLQATIGLLVAKTLTTATVNPFLASSTTTWNPVLAFDVFNVQATTNALLSHFFSLLVSLWLLRTIANRPSAANVMGKAAVV